MNKKYFAVAAAMLAAVIATLWLAGNYLHQPTAFSFARAEAGAYASKTIYLTFDDGPSDRITPKILDVLDDEGVKATFFIIGRQAETRKGIIEREHLSGHTVAVHSYTHDYSNIYRSAESLIADIDRCNDVIAKITDARADIYRFPGGSFGLKREFIDAVTKHGMRYVDWNASTRDAESACDSENLFLSAVATSTDSDRIILLSHDSTNKTFTPEATRKIIRHYKANGYTFKAL